MSVHRLIFPHARAPPAHSILITNANAYMHRACRSREEEDGRRSGIHAPTQARLPPTAGICSSSYCRILPVHTHAQCFHMHNAQTPTPSCYTSFPIYTTVLVLSQFDDLSPTQQCYLFQMLFGVWGERVKGHLLIVIKASGGGTAHEPLLGALGVTEGHLLQQHRRTT